MNVRRTLITVTLVVAAFVWTATVGAMYHAIRQFESTPGRETVFTVRLQPARLASRV